MFTTDELIKAIKGIPVRVKGGRIRGVSCDSRTIRPGMVFFALKGKRFDGHNFVRDIKKRGALLCIVEKRVKGIPYILVKDTIIALGDLAAYYRRRFKVTIIAVTGSNGKTTTKNLIAAFLSTNHRVLKNPHSYNNFIGLPLTLFGLHNQEIAVVEMGMSEKGEIKRLCQIADPEIGIITNIGPAHLETLGDMEGVRKAKLELLSYLKGKGSLIINGDDPLLQHLKGYSRVYTFGIYEKADLRATRVEVKGDSTNFWVEGRRYKMKLLGLHNVYNALGALLCAELIDKGRNKLWEKVLEDVKPEPMRIQIHHKGRITIINDAYNANPYSMIEALRVLSLFHNRRRIAVLGDMRELGKSSERFHQQIGKEVKRMADFTIAVGDDARFYLDKGDFYFRKKEEAIKFIHRFLKPGDVVLIKGSRVMRMEKVVASILRS